MRLTFKDTYLHPLKAYEEQPEEDVRVNDGQPVEVTAGPLAGLRGKVYHRGGEWRGISTWYVDGFNQEEVLDRMRQHVIIELGDVLTDDDIKFVLHEALGRLNRR